MRDAHATLQGKKFDPEVAQAVTQVPPAEGRVAGTVAEEFQSAYMLNDRLIRAAMVCVVEGSFAAKPPPADNANNSGTK
jgi:molecular chaperone GrpE (heat shock protein)